MKVSSDQISYLCNKVFDGLKDKGILIPKSDKDSIIKKMIEEMENNFREEAAIDNEARKMLAQYKDQISNASMNQSKLFMMLKKELAKKKGFIL